MKVKDLKSLLENEADGTEIVFSHEYDCMVVETRLEGIIHESDGFQSKILLCDKWAFDRYDEDYEHGVKKELINE